jgi:pre-mRNA-splicing factor ATP-dependent RNA helicase DHX15/PRP43
MKNAVDVRTQLSRLMDKFELNRSSNTSKSPKYYENIKKALISGFSMQVAYRYRDGIFTLPKCQGINYKTVKDQPVAFDALTFVKDEPDFVIYNELVSNAGNSGKCFIRIVTGIKAKWLLSMAPRYYDSSTLPEGHVNEEFVNLQKLKTSHQLDPNSEECKLN